MKINEITIIIDFKIYAYLFEPIIPYLLGRNVKVTICLPDALKPQILLVYSHFKNLNYTSLTRIKVKNRFRFGIHRACSILFTRTDFSFLPGCGTPTGFCCLETRRRVTMERCQHN